VGRRNRGCRRLYNEELNVLQSSPDIFLGDQIEKNEMGGPYSMYGEERGAYRVLVGKPEGKRQLGKPRHKLEDNIEMDLQEVGWGHGLDSSGSGQGQVAGTCECSNEPSGSIKCREFLDLLRTGWLLKKDSALWT